ncbi:MAG: hypothetical protein IJ837_01950 [Clostridia bacterium]|nr:hypothetical protein [Clostridia bacterium]
MRRVAFIGHRLVLKDIKQKLKTAIENEIKNGNINFMVGVYGDFDKLTLEVLRELKKIYDIKIEVVVTSLSKIHSQNKNNFEENYTPYKDANIVMFETELEYFKNKITSSNKKMIDCSNVLICYVDINSYKSGAKKIFYYAKRKNLKIINLY